MIMAMPIIIKSRAYNIDTKEEKIELAYLKNTISGREWRTSFLKREVVFTSKGASELANLGMMVTSENMRQFIRYMSALEGANDDVIPWGEATSTLGWHSNGRFIPGMDKGLITDFDEQMGAVVAAYHARGKLDKWIETMQEHREKNRFRFLLAAAFATPLIKLLHHRTFFVYNWGDARGGKTAALKAALSVWGEPDGLMMNFNTTQFGLERQAALFTDLPLGIDERQAAGTGAYGQNKIENLVYMIGEGKGRTRGAKDGGIQKVNRWRTIALATGEEPLTSETSMTGVTSRIIEICKGPFKDEVEAGKMHIDCAANYGLAGPEFVQRLVTVSTDDLKENYDRMMEYVRSVGKGKAGSHVSGIALIALADALANNWIFGQARATEGQMKLSDAKLSITFESWKRAQEMAKEIMKEQISAASGDVNENATRFLADWVFINKASFTEYANQRLGMMGDKDGKVLIIATAMSDALRNAGYNERKTKAYLAEKGIISSYYDEKKDKVCELICNEAYVACNGFIKLTADMTDDYRKLYFELEMPLLYTLYDMECEGISMDKQALEEYGITLSERIEELEAKIYEEAGEEFNINSPKQLGEILFSEEKLGLSGSKKTKTGYSTSADVLEKLAPEHEIVKDILEYRGLSKLHSTYVEGLIKELNDDGKIHCTFQQMVTATGRLSCTEPNLQNIPIRMELGRMIRKVFYPKEGYVFVDADYSQVELRVLAHMSGDEELIGAFNRGDDIHTSTASKVFSVEPSEVTSLQRRAAKAVNFGIVYGESSFGLAANLNISRKEAKQYIEDYFKAYPKMKEFLDGLVTSAKEQGYSTTLLGRRRPIIELQSKNFNIRGFGERVAMNTPIQGSAADIIKIAMVNVDKRLKNDNMKSRLILQVHDELLIEAAKDEEQAVYDMLKEEMMSAMKLSVPLEIDVHSGTNWYEAK